MFDPNQFMSSAVEPMATQIEVCPEGEYPFIFDTDAKMLTPKNLKGTSKNTGNTYDFWQLELVALCMDEAVKQKLSRQKVPVRLRVSLDLNTDTGALEVGPNKNVNLGRLREALGQNKPGWKPSDLLGAGPFIGKVVHSRDEKGNTYADIARTTKVS